MSGQNEAHPDVVDLAHLFLELVQDAHVRPQVGLALQLRNAVLVRLQYTAVTVTS